MIIILYIYLFTLLIPIDLFLIGGYYVGASDITFIVVAYAFVQKIFLNRKLNIYNGLVKNKLNIPIFALIILSIFSYILNLPKIDIHYTFTTFIKWIAAWILFFIVVNSFRNIKVTELLRLKRIILIISIIVVLLSFINSIFPVEMATIFKSIYEEERLITFSNIGRKRYFLPLLGTNRYAPFLLLPLFISLSFLLFGKSKFFIKTNVKKTLYLLLAILFGFFLIHTYTRSAIIGIIVGFTVLISFFRLSKRIIISAISVVIVLFLVISFQDLFIPYVKGREYPSYAPVTVYGTFWQTYVFGHIYGRFYIFSLALKQFFQNPFFGKGFGVLLKGDIIDFGHAHNSYLSALYNLGIFGFTAYLIILFRIFKIIKLKIKERSYLDEAKAFLIACLAWFASLIAMSLFESVLFSFPFIIGLILFILGIIYNISHPETLTKMRKHRNCSKMKSGS